MSHEHGAGKRAIQKGDFHGKHHHVPLPEHNGSVGKGNKKHGVVGNHGGGREAWHVDDKGFGG